MCVLREPPTETVWHPLVLTTFFTDKHYGDRDWRGIQQKAE
jgi:hypothetical protein